MSHSGISRQTSILLANKNESLKNYIKSVKKKHAEDADYAKWDLNVCIMRFFFCL